MKYIVLIILCLWGMASYSQTIGYMRYDTVKIYTTKPGGRGSLDVTGNVKFTGLLPKSAGTDSVIVRDASGNLGTTAKSAFGGGATNTSIGSGYKIAVNGTNNIKSLTAGWGAILDSATAGQVGIKVDSNAVKALTPQFDATVDFSVNVNPNTVGTTFNPNTPQLTTKIYVSTIDGSQWTWNGSAYIAYFTTNWSIFGNAFTDPSVNFIGTTDVEILNFRVLNAPSGSIDGANDNVSFGIGAGAGNSGGSSNTAYGNQSLGANTSGSGNTGVGKSSLTINTTGDANIALGNLSGFYTNLSNRLYINSIDRTDILGDTTKSIIYGAQDATAANQRLYLNSRVFAPYIPSGLGDKSVRYNTTTKEFTYADTTAAAGGSSITVGTTPITSGTSGRIPFNNANVYSESAALSHNLSTTNPYLTITGSSTTNLEFAGNGASALIQSTFSNYGFSFIQPGHGVATMTHLQSNNSVGIQNAYPTSALHTTSFATAYTATATSLGLTIAHNVVEVTATGQTITLPTSVGISGRIYTIKLTASGSGTIATTSSQTIDGSTTYSLASQYKYVTVQSNGANWIIIAQN